MSLAPVYLESLKQLGYTEREAEFLYIVAVHSGFFLQRQFSQYLGIAGRGPVTDFIKKAIQRQDVREHEPDRGTQKTYHLFSRNLYSLIGKENSRNRKTGRYGLLDKAAPRLLSLDFVLGNLDHVYLEEEADKVEYLTVEKGISADSLPAKVFPGKGGSETRHYFVERFPIFLSGRTDVPIANFTYIEDQLRSLQTFSSFVQRYRPLFEALKDDFRLIFVSNSTQSFMYARKTFAETLSPERHGRERQELARFFWLKRMAEEKRFKELAHKDVIEWQRGLKRYRDPEYNSQYELWKKIGKLVGKESVHSTGDRSQQFETYLVVPHRVQPSASDVGAAAPSDAPTAAPEHSF
ncbi:MAG TPA: hypothetical protein VNX88_12335 [Terriglobales bacterium]|jgi:hypothetical protein|nr:hypothetical protein [Terriglobales bacterium]